MTAQRDCTMLGTPEYKVEQPSDTDRRRAARAVAQRADDAGDCAMLLDMLGLDPKEDR